MRGWRGAVFIAIVGLGFWARLNPLLRDPFNADEAESAINALTILRDGTPKGDYLGLPVFENTLVRPWPGHAEFEFKDTDYSARGLATYHGWIPLYAIAASFRLAGIGPDPLPASFAPRHDAAARRRRMISARAASCLFGLLAVIALFVAGRALAGPAAGLAAMLIGAMSSPVVHLGIQARYYAAALLVNALAGWLLWRAIRVRTWGRLVLAGIGLGMLFHIHIVSFAALAALAALNARSLLATRTEAMKTMVMTGIVAVLAVPWMLWTGFLTGLGTIVPAYKLMSFPRDLAIEQVLISEYGVVLAISGMFALWVRIDHRRAWTARLRSAFSAGSGAIRYLTLWLMSAYFGFIFLTPAPSYFIERATIPMLVPVILLVSAVLVFLLDALVPRYSTAAALGLTMLFILVSNLSHPGPSAADSQRSAQNLEAAISGLAALKPDARTRVYASPSQHLVLSFLTGIPIQSIAPVRREFFNCYRGRIIYLDSVFQTPHPGDPAAVAELQPIARSAGITLTPEQARRLSWRIAWDNRYRELSGKVKAVHPVEQPMPAFAVPIALSQATLVRERAEKLHLWHQARPLYRGFPVRSAYESWTTFFYRFADATKRRENPAWEERFRNATAYLCEADWVIYDSPGRSELPTERTAGISDGVVSR